MGGQSAFADLVWGHWQTLLAVSNAAWGLSEAWIFARDWRRVAGVSQDRFSLAAIILALVASLAASTWCGAHATFARLPDGDVGAVRFAGGIALMWLGIGYRQWAVATLGRFFRTTVVVQDDHRLVTNGPYRRLRNPSYTGLMVTVLGQGLIMGNWLALLVLVGGVLAALTWRIEVEARALRSRFGASWDAYAKSSWALIPWVW
jgi:protein-S-isoprenylcysteine O-methyltransferase Ste14